MNQEQYIDLWLILFYILEIIYDKKFDLILIGLILIICCLIYLEMIQLNFYNLNENTKINNEKRMNKGINDKLGSNSYINHSII